MRRTTAALILVLACCGAAAACVDNANASCKSSSCHLTLSEGESLTLDGQKFTINHVDDDRITFDSHGVSLTLSKGTDIGIGRFHLHLGSVDGSSASVDVSK